MKSNFRKDKIMEKNKSLSWFITAGHVVECFDNTLYGFFAVVLAPIFFPSSTPGVALLASYGAFAAGFLARPLGAVLFGHIGDKKGRKQPLLLSMMLVGIPTIGIGITPSYESLGIAAPIFLVLCRLAQGVFYGSEFTGVNLYISENFSKGTVGRRTGLLISSGVWGAVLATALGALVSMKSMPSWGWRLPFLFGGASAFCVYLFRKNLLETADFTKAKLSNTLLTFPWKELFHNHKMALVAACLISGLQVIPLYFATIFGNSLFKELGFSTSESMLLNMVAMGWDGFIIIFYGRLADRIGFHRQMLLGTLATAALAFPAFYMIHCTSYYAWLYCSGLFYAVYG
jgi:MHS family proline/betaine transporter-like MFS transporter